MIIPENDEIIIIGRTIKIKYDMDIFEEDGELGNYKHDRMEIWLCEKGGNRFPVERMQLVFLHEVLHAIMATLEYPDLNNNEQFIDQVAELWYQILPQIDGN